VAIIDVKENVEMAMTGGIKINLCQPIEDLDRNAARKMNEGQDWIDGMNKDGCVFCKFV
jgi:hypothetical protein